MPQLRENMDTTEPKPVDKRSRKRITVYLDENGQPDLESLKDDERSKLGLAGSPDSPADAEPAAQIDPAVVGMMFHMLCTIESAFVAPRMGITSEQAREALTPPEPIRDSIIGAGTKVLNKYGGALGRWADELALASVIVLWQTQAFAEMKRMQPIPQMPPPPVDIHETIQPEPVVPIDSADRKRTKPAKE